MGLARVNILYFARIAELTGKRSESWPIENLITGNDLLKILRQFYPQLNSIPRLYLAVNQIYANKSVCIQNGDEVAIFEPVTGG
ncbi:MAG: MoaD/ThiS family protein [Bordetella sp.]|nr:MAG: MoaD/ThiS family protein [Bordetella sp.]